MKIDTDLIKQVSDGVNSTETKEAAALEGQVSISFQNNDGIESSELFLRNLGLAVADTGGAQKVKAIVEQWRGIMRGEIITGNET